MLHNTPQYNITVQFFITLHNIHSKRVDALVPPSWYKEVQVRDIDIDIDFEKMNHNSSFIVLVANY